MPWTSPPLALPVRYVWFSAPGRSQYFVPYDLVGNTLGSTVRLPYVPNSMVMDQLGTTLYFGSSHALMTFSTLNNSVDGAPNTSVPGVVLAVSPNDKQLLINDPVRRVFYIYNTAGSVAANFTAYRQLRRMDTRFEDVVCQRQRIARRGTLRYVSMSTTRTPGGQPTI